jgi:hypothetical protein
MVQGLSSVQANEKKSVFGPFFEGLWWPFLFSFFLALGSENLSFFLRE